MTNPRKIFMPERPGTDCDLSEEIVRRTLQEQFPDLDPETVDHVGAGWSSDVYLVNGGLVVRFPRNAELAGWMEQDEAILGLVHSAIDSAVRVPKIILKGRGSVHFPHPFLGYELIPGIGADDPRTPDSEELVPDLAKALSHIHSIPVSSARKIGLVRHEDDPFTGRPCFLHGDFMPDNIIVDPETGRLVGIIDWGNAAIGDPALDFIWFVLWRGWDFARSVLDAYELPVDDGMVERVGFHARIRAVEWLADTVRRGGNPENHLSWVRNAFSMEGGL
jgi:aminoglycoside phosphotransferase (APT) family kinase protein